MGTRADFYVGRGTDAVWLGSIGWDGYPDGIRSAILRATDEGTYRTLAEDFIDNEGGTTPEMGWPWPWDDSRTTDYAYAYEDGVVYASSFGHDWFVPDLEVENCGEPENSAKTATFPDMADRKAVTLDPQRSGVIVFGGPA